MYLTHRHGGNFISRLTLRIMCFDSKPGCGTPALFAEISNLYGIKKNGYTGLTTDMLFSNSSAWEDLLPGHKTTLDTMYTMTIPYEALGVTKEYVKNNGIGIMHVSTYGASGITSIPADELSLNFGADRSAPQLNTTQLKLEAIAAGGQAPYK